MSLIGSLEDLGLGDILQIIHLSQKSGVLSIRGAIGEGRIVFQGGLVRLANLKGDPEDLRALTVDRGFVADADFEAAEQAARETGCELSVALAKRASIPLERIESLRRECIEHAVGEMFSWVSGEFSFDVGAEEEFVNGDMALSTGVNAQYLAMESMRLWDEGGRSLATELDAASRQQEQPDPESELDLDISAEEMFGVTSPEPVDTKSAADVVAEAAAEAAVRSGEPILETENAHLEVSNAEEILLAEPLLDETLSTAEWAEPELESETVAFAEPSTEPEILALAIPEPQESPAPIAAPPRAIHPPVVVIDSQLNVLDWVRSSLAGTFSSVHIFQRSQDGLGRIRQYLARAQAPILLVSPKIEGNPLSGIVDAADFVSRLQGQAPRMPILWLVDREEANENLVPIALPTVLHPSKESLSGSELAAEDQDLAPRILAALAEASATQAEPPKPSMIVPPTVEMAKRPLGGSSVETLERLKSETRALSDASSRGEILPLVIHFASEFFERVAIFMVRDDQIFGIAQHGIDRNGGPTDVEMRALRFTREESSWFSEVIDTGRPVRAAVRNAGDQRVCDLIGGLPETLAYVAPIMSAENVVALLYADHASLPVALGDTSALEVVLQHAGLALDRAALERALSELDDDRS